MKLQINKVVDHGTLDSERVELTVQEDTNLHYFMILDTTYKGGDGISNKMRHTFWFSPQVVNRGDEVYLYTKRGPSRSVEINGGRNKRHIVYWELGSSVWNNTGDAAVLIEILEWDTTKVARN